MTHFKYLKLSLTSQTGNDAFLLRPNIPTKTLSYFADSGSISTGIDSDLVSGVMGTSV